MTTFTGKILALTTVTDTSTVVYTAPSNTTTRVTHLTLSADGTGDSVTINITDSSQGVTKNLLNSFTISPNTTKEFFDFYLEPGDYIRALATTGGHIDLAAFGIEQLE